MKTLALVLLAAVDGGAPANVSPLPPRAAEPTQARPFAATTPLQLVLSPSQQPTVALRVVFRTGAIDDPKGKEGLTALTTRLMIEGGTKSLTGAELREALYPMAAELGADTEKELTSFAARVHKDRMDTLLPIFTEVLTAPRFDPKELERLRTAALNGVQKRLRQENDEELSKVALEGLLYEGHPYRHPSIGTVQGLTAITLDDVKAHWAKVFTQDRAILGLAGSVDQALASKVQATLKALPEKGAPVPALPKTSGVHGQTVIVQRDTLSTAGDFGFTIALRRGDADYFAVALGVSLLGEHRQQHGLLFDELREKRGLNYGTYAYPEHFRQEGGSMLPMVGSIRRQQHFSIWLRPVEPQNGAFATRGAAWFLEHVVKTPQPKERFETARGFLIGATRLREQRDQRRLGQAIDDLLSGTPDFMEQYRAALASLTPEQVQAALAKHLSVDRLNFAFVTKDADGLAAALTQGAPTGIGYPTPKPADVLAADPSLASFRVPISKGALKIVPATQVLER